MRLVSWNVRDLLDDGAALRRVVRGLAPDVALPAGGAPGARAAAGGSHGSPATSASCTSPAAAPRGERPCWRPRRSRSGTSVAGRLPVRGPFTAYPRPGRRRPDRRNRLHLSVACLHLPLEPALRLAHARSGRRAAPARPGPHVVAGDLNETPGQPAWELLVAAVGPDPAPESGPTFPAGRADKRLDVVLAGPGLRVRGYGDGGADPHDVRAATDHVPVAAELGPA